MDKPFQLASWVDRFKPYPGFTRKTDLPEIRDILSRASDFGSTCVGIGDDAGVIRQTDGFLLLTADGIMPEYLSASPYLAGRSSVLVNVNDIYAMGGRPLCMVDILSGSDKELCKQVLEGIRDGAELYRVPVLGGHYHPDGKLSLGVAMAGRADSLLKADRARPGQALVVAYDLLGEPGSYALPTFDAVSGKNSEQLIHRLEALPLIADSGWATACRDISNGGLVGTLLAMLSMSGAGGKVHLDAVPRPDSVEPGDWFLTFPSYGFVLSVHIDYIESLVTCSRIEASKPRK